MTFSGKEAFLPTFGTLAGAEARGNRPPPFTI